MKKMHSILAVVASLLAIRIRVEPVNINSADADTLAEVMVSVSPTGKDALRNPFSTFFRYLN